MSPQNSEVEAVTPSVMLSGRWSGHERRGLMMGEETPDSCPLSPCRRAHAERAVSGSQERPSLNLQPPELCESRVHH